MSLATLAISKTKWAIDNYGESVVFKYSTDDLFDDTHQIKIPGVENTHSTKAVKDSSSYKYLGYKYGEDLVQSDDFEIMIASEEGFTPAAEMKLLYRSKEYRVVQIKEYTLGTVVVAYTLLVRL